MARISKSRSKAPKKDAATVAAPSEHAAGVSADAAATPPGMSVPGGTNTTASESGAAAGSVSTDQVKPHDKDGTSTPVTVTDATSGQSAPEAEAAASGGIARGSEPSQGDAAGGAGDDAGPADGGLARMAGGIPSYGGGGLVPGVPAAPVFIGADLGRGADVGVISFGSELQILSDVHPRAYAFFAALLERYPSTALPVLFVTSRANGFRRGGVAHSTDGLTFLPGEYSAEQLEAFLSEPKLTVELV